MKTLEELINKEEPGWELITEWIGKATNKVEVLARNSEAANLTLFQTQVTTRSPMGAIIYETGGILIDNGWIRILGSGNKMMNRTLSTWNNDKSISEYGQVTSYLLIADDVVGGFFAINGGAFGKDLGSVYYFSPDRLEWEPLEIGYSDFVWWALTGNLNDFYKGLRWNGWEDEISKINGDEGISFYPFLWTKYDSIEDLSRKPVPIEEIWSLQLDIKNQLDNKK